MRLRLYSAQLGFGFGLSLAKLKWFHILLLISEIFLLKKLDNSSSDIFQCPYYQILSDLLPILLRYVMFGFQFHEIFETLKLKSYPWSVST